MSTRNQDVAARVAELITAGCAKVYERSASFRLGIENQATCIPHAGPATKWRQREPGTEPPRYARVRPMPTLADMLKSERLSRRVRRLCAGALRLSPQELADLTLQVAGLR